MLQDEYLLSKIGANTTENNRNVAIFWQYFGKFGNGYTSIQMKRPSSSWEPSTRALLSSKTPPQDQNALSAFPWPSRTSCNYFFRRKRFLTDQQPAVQSGPVDFAASVLSRERFTRNRYVARQFHKAAWVFRQPNSTHGWLQAWSDLVRLIAVQRNDEIPETGDLLSTFSLSQRE